MDRAAEVRRERLRQIKDITGRVWALEAGKLMGLKSCAASIRTQEGEILDRLTREPGCAQLLIARLEELRLRRATVAREIEVQQEVVTRAGRRARSSDRFYEKIANVHE